MQACLILLTLAVSPSTTQVVSPQTVDQKLDDISDWLEIVEREAKADFRASIEKLQNATSQLFLQCNSSQLLSDLEVLKSRQAVAGAIQGAQVFLFLAYLATIAVCYLVKRCRKHQKEVAKAEFELLETKLQASRSRRRAAAAARTNKQTPQ